jgi:hypothetical protein
MSHNRKIATENVVHLQNGILFIYNKQGYPEFCRQWMELENIILSEVSQSQKDVYGMYSLISGY